MEQWEIKPGRRVRVMRPHLGRLAEAVLTVECFPVRGLYRDYVLCRGAERLLYFLPDELSPVDTGEDPSPEG